MKSHIGPNGPGKCNADKEPCPFGGDDNHFKTIGAARKEYENRLASALKNETAVKVKERKLTEHEQELRANNARMARDLIQARADSVNEGITFDDANPDRAKRRLDEAITFAQSRNNEVLTYKLTHAKVLPSGAFRLNDKDKTRVNTDSLLTQTLVTKQVDAARNHLINKMTRLLAASPNRAEKYQVRTDAGLFSATVSDNGFSQTEFDQLSPKLQSSISSPKESLNIDLARENLAPSVLRQITTESQVIDYVIGKEPETGVSYDDTALKGLDASSKMNDGLKRVSDLYSGVASRHGKVRDLKKGLDAGNNAIKIVAANRQGNVFAPARSQMNGALVSNRTSINIAKAREILSPDQIASITATRSEPDRDKAAAILPKETFDKIFNNVKLSLRVTESK